jgi:heat shock protein HtpX
MGRLGHHCKAALALAILLAFYLVVVLSAYSVLAAVRVTAVLGSAGALGVVLFVSLVVMYAHYRFGVARIVDGVGARELSPDGHEALFTRVDRLADAVGIDRPRVYLAPLDDPNAMALGGPRHGRLVLTTALLETLDGNELDAILAHEFVHLKHRDSVVQSLGHGVVRLIGGVVWVLFLAAGYVAALVAFAVGERPRKAYGHDLREGALRQGASVAATLLMIGLVVVTRTLSRQREYVADAGAVAVTNDLASLASALRKIDAASGNAPAPEEVPPSLFVVGMADAVLGQWFDSHPPVDRRVARLRERFEDRSSRPSSEVPDGDAR